MSSAQSPDSDGSPGSKTGPLKGPRLFLVGMMGAGKTTVGRLMARALNWEFIDCDREIEARSGVNVSTIFELEGEAAFRRRETATLEELTQRDRIVLATGGGAVLADANRALLRERGLVVYLQASADEIARRTANDRSRPLLQTADPRARIEQLLTEREPLYRQAAHLSFSSPAANPRRLVKRILEDPQVLALLAAD